MNAQPITNQDPRVATLMQRKLPDLHELYAATCGQPTKVVNKGWLARHIVEAAPDQDFEVEIQRGADIEFGAEDPMLTVQGGANVEAADHPADDDHEGAPLPKVGQEDLHPLDLGPEQPSLVERTPGGAELVAAALAKVQKADKPSNARVVLDLDGPSGPRCFAADNMGAESIEAALPAWWTVGDNWVLAVAIGDGRVAYPIVAKPFAGQPGDHLSKKMPVEWLLAQYRLEVGRDTGSTDKGYLIWKVKETRNGRYTPGPVGHGPKQAKEPGAPKSPVQVLTLQVTGDAAAALDDVAEQMGFKSRMALMRAAIAGWLVDNGKIAEANRWTAK